MLRTALKYGAIAAAIMTAVIIVPFWFQDPDRLAERMGIGEVVGYATMLLAMGLIVFAVREHRNRDCGGRIGFGRALAVGMAVTLVAATLFGAATAAMYASMEPERIDAFMQVYVRQSVGPDADAATVQPAMAGYEANRELWLNPLFQGFVMFATLMPIGLLVSLVAALVLRRRAPPA